jgi:hypothetical protein
MRARFPLVMVLAVLVGALGLLAAGCGGSAGHQAVATPTTLEGLASAARRSADASTGRFEFSVTMSMPGFGDGFGLSGEGAFDSAAGKTEMRLDLSALLELFAGLADAFGGTSTMGDLDPDDFVLDTVLDGLVVYLRMPFLADKLPAGTEWVKIDLREQAARIPGLDVDELLQFTRNGPQATLDYLRAVSGEIVTVGTEELRGVPTTHHRATIDLRRYASLVPEAQREQLGSMLDQLARQTGLESFPVDVWVGEDGLVRKLELTMSISRPGGGQSASAAMSYEMFDNGEPVTITLPLPEDTADAATLGP